MPNQPPQSPKGVFVTGTDTNVGKTVVTAALGIALQQTGGTVGILKPVETGTTQDAMTSVSDGDRYRELFAPHKNVDVLSLYCFPSPIVPLEAACISQQPIDVQAILDAYQTLAVQHDYMLVEGVGGILVPLTQTQDVRNLIELLGLPCLIVSRTSLGSINHARLTLMGLRQAGIPILGILLNQTSADTTREEQQQTASAVKLIRELSEVPVLGPLPFQPHLHLQWEDGITTLANHSIMRDVTRMVQESD